MEKARLRRPFFVVNPKSYLYGDAIFELAQKANDLAQRYDFDCLFTAQLVDLPYIAKTYTSLTPCAQTMDGIVPGRGMGHVLPEALVNAGIQATFLNHAENPCTIHELAAAISRANELGILSVVCADSVEEGATLAALKPDVMVCELTSLIGTGQVADEDYMRSSTQRVKEVSPSTLVLQAAGISNGQNVYDAIRFGADGTGGTSGIVAADDPLAMLDEMFAALDKARTDFCLED